MVTQHKKVPFALWLIASYPRLKSLSETGQIGQTPTWWHSVSSHAHPYSHFLPPTISIHAGQSKRHMHADTSTDALHPKTHTDTHTQRAAMPPSSSQSEKSDQKAKPASLLLWNSDPLTHTAGVTKQLNEGSEKAGNWLLVISNNFSPMPSLIDGSMEQNMKVVRVNDANLLIKINWPLLYRCCLCQLHIKSEQLSLCSFGDPITWTHEGPSLVKIKCRCFHS